MNVHITNQLITTNIPVLNFAITDQGHGFTSYKNTGIILCYILNLDINYLVLFGLDLTNWYYECKAKNIITSMCKHRPTFFDPFNSCSAKVACCNYSYIPIKKQLHILDLTHDNCVHNYVFEYTYTGHVEIQSL